MPFRLQNRFIAFGTREVLLYSCRNSSILHVSSSAAVFVSFKSFKTAPEALSVDFVSEGAGTANTATCGVFVSSVSDIPCISDLICIAEVVCGRQPDELLEIKKI